MNQIAVLAAVETVSYPPRTTRAILRGKYISQGKKTMRPNAPRWANQQFADSGGIAHALKEYALSDPPSCIRHNLTDSTDFERNSVYLIQILRQKHL